MNTTMHPAIDGGAAAGGSSNDSAVTALCLHDGDDVAVMRIAGTAGNACTVVCDAQRTQIRLATDVPFGHKVALRSLKAGEPLRKYGQPIGIVLVDIPQGGHVHVHNLRGLDAAKSGSH